MIFLYSSLHSIHILNLHLFSANLVKKIDMTYHALFFSITYLFNCHIFYDLCGCRDIGMQVGKHGYG